MLITKEQIINAVSQMSVMDVMELVSMMEKKFGVSAAEPSVETKNNSNEITEEKTDFNVFLRNIGANKIAVIKSVRSITGLGLKEAKDLVESSPSALIKSGVNKKDANVLKETLELAGASIEIK